MLRWSRKNYLLREKCDSDDDDDAKRRNKTAAAEQQTVWEYKQKMNLWQSRRRRALQTVRQEQLGKLSTMA